MRSIVVTPLLVTIRIDRVMYDFVEIAQQSIRYPPEKLTLSDCSSKIKATAACARPPGSMMRDLWLQRAVLIC